MAKECHLETKNLFRKNNIYKVLFIIGLLAGAFALASGPCIAGWLFQLGIGQCFIYDAFGIYCPGCGGTRALIAFLEGNWVESFCYHPVILVAFIIYAFFMASCIANLLTKGRIPFYKIGYKTLLLVLFVILIQWAIKVFLQLNYGYVIP